MVFRPTTIKEWKENQLRAAGRRKRRLAKRKVLFKGTAQAVGKAPLRAKLDALWGFFIRLRDRLRFGNVCRIRKAKGCSGLGEVAYHILPRGRSDATRWHPSNGVLACSACNRGEQMNRQKYARYHEKLFGRETIDFLNGLAEAGAKYSRQDLVNLAGDLRSMIAGLGGPGRAICSR